MRKGTTKRRIKKALIPGYGTKKATEYKSYFRVIIGILFLAFAVSVCSGCEPEQTEYSLSCSPNFNLECNSVDLFHTHSH